MCLGALLWGCPYHRQEPPRFRLPLHIVTSFFSPTRTRPRLCVPGSTHHWNAVPGWLAPTLEAITLVLLAVQQLILRRIYGPHYLALYVDDEDSDEREEEVNV